MTELQGPRHGRAVERAVSRCARGRLASTANTPPLPPPMRRGGSRGGRPDAGWSDAGAAARAGGRSRRRVIEVRGQLDDALRLSRARRADGTSVVNSVNPDRIEAEVRRLRAARAARGAPTSWRLPSGGGNVQPSPRASPRRCRARIISQAADRTTTWASAIRIAIPRHAEHVRSSVAAAA